MNFTDTPLRQVIEDIRTWQGINIYVDMPALAESLATGVDHFLRCPHLRRETILTSARGIHGPSMRETAAWLMLAVSRDAARLVHAKDGRRWERGERWPLLAGRTAVVVGIGVSGMAIGELLKAFGMRVVGVSRTPLVVTGERLSFDTQGGTQHLLVSGGTQDYGAPGYPAESFNRLIGRGPRAYHCEVVS